MVPGKLRVLTVGLESRQISKLQTPKQDVAVFDRQRISCGLHGKNNLGGITERGDTYLRSLLIQGAKSAVMSAHKRSDPISQWVAALRDRAGWQKATVALANKNACILWAVMTKGEAFDARHVSVKPGTPTPAAADA